MFHSKPKTDSIPIHVVLQKFKFDYLEQCDQPPSEKQRLKTLLHKAIYCGDKTKTIRKEAKNPSGDLEMQTIHLWCQKYQLCLDCHRYNTNKWVREQKARLPYCTYSFVGVRPPSALNTIIEEDKKFWYDALSNISATAVMEFAHAEDHLGAIPIIIAGLHTFSKLEFDPHFHIIVSNCGMRDGQLVMPKSNDWIDTAIVAARIRELMIEHVKKNYRHWEGKPKTYQFIHKCIQEGQWKVHCRPRGDSKYDNATKLKMMLNYIKRNVLDVHQITKIDNDHVTVQYKDRSSKHTTTETLKGIAYYTQLMRHNLPEYYHQARCSGLAHPSQKAALEQLKHQLNMKRLDRRRMLFQNLVRRTKKTFCCIQRNYVLWIPHIDLKKRNQICPNSNRGYCECPYDARASPDVPPFIKRSRLQSNFVRYGLHHRTCQNFVMARTGNKP